MAGTVHTPFGDYETVDVSVGGGTTLWNKMKESTTGLGYTEAELAASRDLFALIAFGAFESPGVGFQTFRYFNIPAIFQVPTHATKDIAMRYFRETIAESSLKQRARTVTDMDLCLGNGP